jgi:hypothetical protein
MTTQQTPPTTISVRPTVESSARARPFRPVLLWASIGGLILAFQIYVLARWITGPHFTPTHPTGPPLPDGKKILFLALQMATPAITVGVLYWWVVRPWRRERRMTTDGMLAIAAGTLFFWDMSMNYTSVQLLYNSHLVNMGAWANGSWPGWTSPNANRLPEPLLVTIPGYVAFVFTQVIAVLAIVRRAKRRWPTMGIVRTLGLIILVTTITDTIVEALILRTGAYAYPGGIRAITLFAGHTYQLPLTESFLIGGLAYGSIVALSHFRDDLGRTFVERGLDQVKAGVKTKQALKFLAIYGCVHLAIVVLYVGPNQWLGTHQQKWPAHYPSYLINGMCATGASGHECPGPGVLMPRPTSTL